MLALTGFCIKQKSQDTSVHHTSLVPVVGRWSHSLLLKELIVYSQGYVGGAKVKSPSLYNGRGIYSQGWCFTLVTLGLPSWPLNFLWIFNWHDSSISYVHPLDFHFTLHSVTTYKARSGDVAKTTHDTTWHETAGMY